MLAKVGIQRIFMVWTPTFVGVTYKTTIIYKAVLMKVIQIEFIFGSLIATGTATIDAISPQRFSISFKWEPSIICSNNNYTTKKQPDTIECKKEGAFSQKVLNNWEFSSDLLPYKSNLIISNYYGKKLFFSNRNLSNGAVPFLGGRSPPYVSFYSTSGFNEPFCS